MRKIIRRLALLSALGATHASFAQDDPYTVVTVEAPSSRVLNGHTFIPISLLRGPFVETSFAGSLEYGATSSDAPRYDLNGAPIGTNNDSLSVVGQRLGFQFKVTDWLALRLGGDLFAYLPVDTAAALSVGASLQTRVLGGATFAFRAAPSVQLAATIDGSYGPKGQIDIINPLLQGIQQGDINNVHLVSITNGTSIIGGFSGAYAAADWLGFLMRMEYSHLFEPTLEHVADTDLVGLGAAVETDLTHPLHFPAALQAMYLAQIDLAGNSRIDHTAGLGLYYVGREDLVLGLDLSVRWFELLIPVRTAGATVQTQSADSVGGLGQVVMRYFW